MLQGLPIQTVTNSPLPQSYTFDMNSSGFDTKNVYKDNKI
jgi:hypothetical protein